ncbi:uncharacterized membrane protein YgaE (UPF0421/DUF939 family) [Lachnotalea glycerini]|uniref:Uncharacterized membrane protein YgaE (UPF0421/DUF939 family) n=1 Tax=Lachnotalea glycerini TaxID=1763509 RepID=A0A255IIQ0_9FIRM|nr:aromatic acid exporter family protein [Lachnotalea glycerini]PXV93321.1 uncharacterized membrane protein YgaE (UPF0421/DUF939 family) [Lachnotalea glycerini]RDY31974.1 hypothetical protein CG710_006630 [Lachnotalea glycerini]
MDKKKKLRAKKFLILSLKISIGSCIAIYIANMMQLEFAASAGIITLLTIMTTKWETLKLSFYRLLTFIFSVGVLWLIFQFINQEWMAYGLFIFVLVLICEWINWKSTISVNAVIGSHFLMTHDFSNSFIINEFLLVAIGISIAIIMNLFQNATSQKAAITKNMRYTEKKLQFILDELANYLFNKHVGRNVWDDIISLEEDLAEFVEKAYEYQNNTFYSHPSYYIHYFEMRTKQFNVLHNLHYEMKKLRNIPKQATIVAEYIMYLKEYVTELNDPIEQIEKLNQLFEQMGEEELPKSREELEGRAKLYHILMDLEEFLIFKKRFVDSIDEEQFKIYWRKEVEQKVDAG